MTQHSLRQKFLWLHQFQECNKSIINTNNDLNIHNLTLHTSRSLTKKNPVSQMTIYHQTLDLNVYYEYSFGVLSIEGALSWDKNYHIQSKHKKNHKHTLRIQNDCFWDPSSFSSFTLYQPLKLMLQLTLMCWGTWHSENFIASTQKTHITQNYTQIISMFVRIQEFVTYFATHLRDLQKKKICST
jgi:hypothetical protein